MADEHLRNHGFLLTDTGWRLSPAYDINPNEYGTGLHLNISEADNALEPEPATSLSSYFSVSEARGRQSFNR
jgi:serine/threonine-protein kinase HipA